MGFEQYHEPANELSQETRTFARMITSLTEEAKEGDIVEHGEEAEEAENHLGES